MIISDLFTRSAPKSKDIHKKIKS